MKNHLIYTTIVAVLLITACTPDNPLRGTEVIYNYYGVVDGSADLYKFDSQLKLVEPEPANLTDLNTADRIYYEDGFYYILSYNPNILIKMDENFELLATIDLPDGDIRTVDFVNSTEALVSYNGQNTVTEIDLFFDTLGLTHQLPFVPYSSIAPSNENVANRIIILSSEGALGYFDIRDNSYYSITETGFTEGIIIDRPITGEYYVIGSTINEVFIQKYDAETNEELNKAQAFASSQQVDSGVGDNRLLAGVWGGLASGYFATATRLYTILDIDGGAIVISPTDTEFSGYVLQSAMATNTRNYRGITFLLRGTESYVLNFEEDKFSAHTINFSDKRIKSLVSID